MPTLNEQPLRNQYLPITLSAVLSALLAYYLYGGMINPTNVDWLIREGDSLPHYLGWHFFRREPWQWPLGALSTFASDIDTSIVFTDAIPLFALPLKLLHSWLPDPFQYLGLAVTLNLVLNATVACRLLLHSQVSPWAALLGGLIVASLPAATMRGLGGHGHEALTAHWLILLGIDFLLFRTHPSLHNALRWLVLLVLAILTHFYLFFMVGVLWSGWWTLGAWRIHRNDASGRLKQWLGVGLITPLTILLSMWAVGYFHAGAGGTDPGGYGYFSAELFTFFNPLSQAWFHQAGLISLSNLWPGWLTPVAGQYEGQAYAGMGVLLLWLIALYVVIRRGPRATFEKIPENVWWLGMLTVGMFFFALSERLVIGYRIFDLDYADLLGPLPAYLRSSGRMVWPLLYVLLLAALVVLARQWAPRKLTLVLVGILIIQWLDLWPWHSFVHETVRTRLRTSVEQPLPYAVLRDSRMEQVWSTHARLIALPAHDLGLLKPYLWLAAENDMSTNVAYVARVSPEVIDQVTQPHRQALMQGEPAKDAVYLLTDEELSRHVCSIAEVSCRTFDGITLAWR